MSRYTCVEDGASKFWEGSVEGCALTTRWGKIGTAGQSKTKALPSEAAAQAELAKLIKEKIGKGYVLEAVEAAAAPPTAPVPAPPVAVAVAVAVAKAVKKKVAAVPFPFLFYGRRPSDWREAAMGGHQYELRFSVVPDDAQRIALAQAFVKKSKKGAAVPARTWLWSGRRVLVDFAEGWAISGKGQADPDAFFEHVDKILRALHEVVPIEEVVYQIATAPGSDEWDRWTLAQKPVPDAGARYRDFERGNSFFRQATDAGAPIGEPDAIFDRAQRVAILGEERVKADEDKLLELRRAGRPAIVPIPLSEMPPAPSLPKSVRTLVGKNAMCAGATRSPMVVALIPDADFIYQLACVDEAGQLHRFERRQRDVTIFALRPDGRRALLRDDSGAPVLLEVSLPDGAVRELWRPGSALIAGGYLPDGLPDGERLFVRTIDHVRVMRIGQGDASPVAILAELESKGTATRATALVLYDGKLIVTADSNGARVFGYDDGARLEALATVPGTLENVYASGDRVFGRSIGFSTGHELINLDVALEKFRASLPG